MFPMVGSAHCILFLMIIEEKLYVAAISLTDKSRELNFVIP